MSVFKGRGVRAWSLRNWVVVLILACLVTGGVSGAAGYFVGTRNPAVVQYVDESGEPVEDPMWFVSQEFDDSGYRRLHDDVVYDYSDVLVGEDIVTVAIVDSIMPGKLYAKTYTGYGSIGFEFDSKKIPLEVAPGDTITVAGVMSDDTRHGATMKHCEIIGFGEIAKELRADSDNQREQLEPLRPNEPADDDSSQEDMADPVKMFVQSTQLSWPALALYMR